MDDPPVGRSRAGNDYAANAGFSHAGTGRFADIPVGYNGVTGAPATSSQNDGRVIRMADVTDGLSFTLMVTERRITPDLYTGANFFNAGGYADPRGPGESAVDFGLTGEPFPPLADGAAGPRKYLGRAGAAHPNGVNAALADGSVRPIRYTISPDL